MDIGKHLQENRVRRGIALGQIARSTKLSTTTLQCIERNDFGRLPGGIFIRGYLRAFATEVGVNPDRVVRAYVEQLPVEPVVDEEPSLRDAVAAHHRLVVGVITAGLGVLIALAVYGAFPKPSAPPAALLPAVLEARPIDLFVAQAIAESSPLAEGTRDARSSSGFVYTLNGEIGRPLGGSETPVTVRITQQNLATFQTGSEAEWPGGEPRSTTCVVAVRAVRLPPGRAKARGGPLRARGPTPINQRRSSTTRKI